MPPSVQEWIPADHLARFVVDVVAKLDLQPIRSRYAGRGSAAYQPETCWWPCCCMATRRACFPRASSNGRRTTRSRFDISRRISIPSTTRSPIGSTGKNNDINNILYLYEGATVSANGIPGGSVIVGWVATTAGGQYYVVSNGRDANLAHNLASQIPVLGQLWAAVNNSQAFTISPSLNGTQASQLFSQYPVGAKSGNGAGQCFTGPLSTSQLT